MSKDPVPGLPLVVRLDTRTVQTRFSPITVGGHETHSFSSVPTPTPSDVYTQNNLTSTPGDPKSHGLPENRDPISQEKRG